LRDLQKFSRVDSYFNLIAIGSHFVRRATRHVLFLRFLRLRLRAAPFRT
jgi:hypothetical protein